MARTLLELLQAAANEIGIPEPSRIVGGVDDQSKQLLSLANREGKDFSMLATRTGGWQALHKEHTFTTVSGTADYAMPSDFEYFVDRTFWDDAYKWELVGPITAQEKQILRYGVIASGPRRKFYVRNNRMYLEPTPTTTGDTIAFDYYSNAWCLSNVSTPQTQWAADTDTYKLDEDCFVQGVKWRFLRAKGLDYAQEKADYDADCARLMGRDGGARDLPIAGGTYGARFLNEDNIPETGYGT
jgi:hypothetical protein